MKVAKSLAFAKASAIQGASKLKKPDNPTSSCTLLELSNLPLQCICDHLDPISLGRLRCTSKNALMPPEAIASAMQQALTLCGSLPPSKVTSTWNPSAWLLHAYMAQKTTVRPYEADDYDDYVTLGAPSQHKYLRLAKEAARGWLMQAYIVSEDLDLQRNREMPLRSLDLSGLYFTPFPYFDRAVRGFPLEHLRLSTARNPQDQEFAEPPITALFTNAPALRCFEMVPKKRSSGWRNENAGFPLNEFCWALAEALEAPLVLQLESLRLDFSQVEGTVDHAISEKLNNTLGKRAGLTDVALLWPS